MLVMWGVVNGITMDENASDNSHKNADNISYDIDSGLCFNCINFSLPLKTHIKKSLGLKKGGAKAKSPNK